MIALPGVNGGPMGSTDKTRQDLPKNNLVSSLQILLRDTRLIRGNLLAQIERIDRIEMELTVLISAAIGDERLHARIGERPGSMIHHLAIQHNPNDSLEIEINSRPPFHLSPRLAGIFLLLAGSNKTSDGALAPRSWYSRSEILCFLERSMRGRIRPQYINNLVHSLRRALSAAGHDPALVQSHKEKGVCLAFSGRASARRLSSRLKETVIPNDSD